MIVPETPKQPYESFFLGADFVNVIDTDLENIDLDNSTVIVTDGSGESDSDVYESATLSVEDDTILKVRVKDGVEVSSPYKFSFRIITTDANKWEKDILLKIEES